MNNILLIGNGFDLAHGLLTNYKQFLYVLQEWNNLYTTAKNDATIDRKNKYYKFIENTSNFNKHNLDMMNELVEGNSWVDYFCECGAEIDGWIDFEKEIYPVIESFEFVFNNFFNVIEKDNGYAEVYMSISRIPPIILRPLTFFSNYIRVDSNFVYLKEPYATKQYGILKKTVLESLRKEFDDFIKAFEIYLLEFVHKKEGLQLLKQIKDINADYVVSFNYTLTEELYGVDKENVHHIHGMIREDLTTGENNMVLGVNESENQNMDFIYFVKYFQRIQKASGVKYKSFIDKFIDKIGVKRRDASTLYIYGHSLDETDEDILKYLIGEIEENNKLNIKPKKVVVFYYDSTDYEQKVINLIKLYGRSNVEEHMEKGLFEFIKTTDEIYNE